jgi:lysine 2,3-aminomutase
MAMTQASKMKTPPAPWNDIPWEQWEDWHWELANRLTTVEQIGKVIQLTEAEQTGIANSLYQLRMAITLVMPA